MIERQCGQRLGDHRTRNAARVRSVTEIGDADSAWHIDTGGKPIKFQHKEIEMVRAVERAYALNWIIDTGEKLLLDIYKIDI